MYAKYIFCALIFLVSFTAGQGALNENVYIKQFAFGAAFTAMTVVTLVIPHKNKSVRIRIVWGDIFVLVLLSVYSLFYIGTCNATDFTLPFLCFLLYVFIRVLAGDTTVAASGRYLLLYLPDSQNDMHTTIKEIDVYRFE
jgi:hypothetical protein